MLLSVVLKVTTTFCECTKRRGRKRRKRSERTNGPQNKGRTEGENFLRFKKRELTVCIGIDQTTNVFFHPQTKENKSFVSLLSPREIYFDVSLKLADNKTPLESSARFGFKSNNNINFLIIIASSIALPHFSKVVRKREIIFITFERENDERRFVDKIFFFIAFLTSSSQ